MVCEWKKTTVGEISDRVTKGTTPTTLGRCFVERGINFIKVESLAEDGRILPDKLAHIDAVTDEMLSRSRLERGDILFTIAGTIGRAALVPKWLLPANTNQAIAIVRPKRGVIEPRFLYYVLRDESRVKHARTRVVQSVQANFSLGELSSLELTLPSLAEQKAIVAVLGALDDKIELNRRMNATLEAMARALFQSWFEGFDPVRAKLDGRKPEGLDEATTDLFPDSFQDSELGHIPTGWTVGRVADVSDFSRSSINPIEFPDEIFDHYSLPAFDEGQIPKAENGSTIMSNKLIMTQKCVLLSKLNPHIPRIWLPELHVTRRSVCSTEFIVASARPGYSCEFLFSLFTCAAFATTYGSLVTGTTGSHQRVRPESVLEMHTVIPPPKLVKAFTAIAEPIFQQINRNIDQSRTLASLRDTLLPKLLSGELSVDKIKEGLVA